MYNLSGRYDWWRVDWLYNFHLEMVNIMFNLK